MTRVRAQPPVRPPPPHKPTVVPSQGGGRVLALDTILNVLDSGLADELVRDVASNAMRRILDDPPRAGDAFETDVARYVAKDAHPGAQSTPRAVVQSLATVASERGTVDPDIAGRLLGPSAKALLVRVQQLVDAHGSTPNVERHALKYAGLDPATAKSVTTSKPHPTFSERMPALASVRRNFGTADTLAGFSVASIQHLLPTTRALYDALVACGVSRSDVCVGGKSYSSNADVVARLKHDGFDVHPLAMPHMQPLGSNSESVADRMAVDQLTTLFARNNPKDRGARFLLLDDGGALMTALHTHFPEHAHQCVVVEQTERGVQVLEAMIAKTGRVPLCPIIDVARSPLKKQVESVLIGESIAFHVEHHLETLSPNLHIEPKVACIVGYGAVGQATAAALQKRGYRVVVTDLDPARCALAAREGCTPLPREQALAQAHLLVSATGHTTITPAEYDLLPNHAVLVNAASGNHELGLQALTASDLAAHEAPTTRDARFVRSSFAGHDVCLGDRADDRAMQHRVWRTDGGKELLLLRSGYVSNMTLGMPPEMVQVTLGLLLGACLQGAKPLQPGLVPLSQSVQRLVLERTQAALAERKLSLDDPDFRAVAAWQV